MDSAVKTQVDVVEWLGNKALLYLVSARATERRTFIARMDPEVDARPGQAFEAVFDVGKAHVFEKESGLAIV